MNEALFLHAFNLLPEFGPARLMRLCRHFKSAEQAFSATAQDFALAGIEPEIIKKFLNSKAALSLQQETEKLQKENIQLLTFKDSAYPKLLLEIARPPVLLYFKGVMKNPDELCMAVVGTRKISNYGRAIVPEIVRPLVQAGITIVSGMAYGVDSAAHEIAFKSNRRTVAVLGGGLDEKSLYPQHHKFLADQILQAGGALLSEYPPGTPNLKHHFVSRNRIISGLCLGTLVVECGLKSGSLITAQCALEQNRQVYAVPGPIYSPESEGPNNLLKMGAKAVCKAEDILEDLNLQNLPDMQRAQTTLADSKEEQTVLDFLGKEPLHIDEVIKNSGLTASAVTSALTFLEMKGRVRNLGGQQYILSR